MTGNCTDMIPTKDMKRMTTMSTMGVIAIHLGTATPPTHLLPTIGRHHHMLTGLHHDMDLHLPAMHQDLLLQQPFHDLGHLDTVTQVESEVPGRHEADTILSSSFLTAGTVC
jgi:hypothetical protein